MRIPSASRPSARAGILAALLLAAGGRIAAHDIPNDVTIQAFLKPEGSTLRLLVRVPLQAMRDIDYPRRDREFVDLARAAPALRDAATIWIARDVELYEGGSSLGRLKVAAVRASLPSDGSFRTYESALSHVTEDGAATDSEFVWNQGVLDVLLEAPIQSERSAFSIEPRWGRLGVRTITALRFVTPDGPVRAFELVGDPGLVRLDPRWHQAAIRFVELGFAHILGGTDHLLFLLCLVIPFRRLRSLVAIVTSFTAAHSLTLIASAYDLAPSALWFPPLIETLIALSIVFMALENIVAAGGWWPPGRQRRMGEASSRSGSGGENPEGVDGSGEGVSGRGWDPASIRRRWLLAFGFGLVHGFGFSFALRETLQFAGSHLLTSLVSFNLGVELGQLLVLALLVPALHLLFRAVVAERAGSIILSALVAHTGWHWMTERAGRLSQYSFQWPAVTASLALDAVRWLMILIVAAGAAWVIWLAWQRSGSHPGVRSNVGSEKLDAPKQIS